MSVRRVCGAWMALTALLMPAARATPPQIDPVSAGVLPRLSLANQAPRPLPGGAHWVSLPGIVSAELYSLRLAMRAEVPNLLQPGAHDIADMAQRASFLLDLAGRKIEAPQLLIVVDRNPARQMLALFVARPGSAHNYSLVGAAHISTGQAGRRDHYITPVGVFAHTDAILDSRALGTYNENHIRGLGVRGMRVWDFGWQWALKGWHTDGEGGDIRLQMHATDPDVLERRLGHPASEGCVRLSAALNSFLDKHGVLDADYEQAAFTDVRYNALLRTDRTPSILAGRLLVVIDTQQPKDTPPTVTSRPADWPDPNAAPPPEPAEDSERKQAAPLPAPQAGTDGASAPASKASL
jgi:hypothetical protein